MITEEVYEAYQKAGENAYFGNGFKAGVEFAQLWISIEFALPEIGDDIILKLREHPLKKYEVWHIADDYDIKLVPVYATHWRPIELK